MDPDAVVGGVSTGGAIVGVGQCFRERNPTFRVVAVEHNESCSLMCGEVGRHLIEGISDGFVPGIFVRHRHLIDEIVAVDSDAAIGEMRRLPRQFGLFAGPRSGAHLLAAHQMRTRHPDLRHVVTFFCDEGDKYINDYFLGPECSGRYRPPPGAHPQRRERPSAPGEPCSPEPTAGTRTPRRTGESAFDRAG